MRISNVDTLSILLDRLVVEHIKRFFFAKNGEEEKVRQQDDVVAGIRQRIAEVLSESVERGHYDYLSERRTFAEVNLLEEIEALILSNIRIGEADRGKLASLRSENPTLMELALHELRARSASEDRARNKNRIDEVFKVLVELMKPGNAP